MVKLCSKKRTFISKVSLQFFNYIAKFNKNNHILYYGQNEYGLSINTDDIKYVKLDFYNKTTNKAIQFYGDFWHCSPLLYKNDDIMPFKHTNKDLIFVKDLWEFDDKRLKLIKTIHNIDVKIIWQNEIKNESKVKELIYV